MAVKKLKAKLDRLEKITQSLENDSLEIESSIKLYEEGMSLIKECNLNLDQLEGRVRILIDGEESEPEKEDENGEF
ncbi:MAG: exodeoxyribonuclease VII small subunit [Eubacteriaceae bacterium]